MNALGLWLAWMAVQVSLFCLAGIVLYAVVRRRGPALAAWTAGTVLFAAIVLPAMTLSPWPRWMSLDAPTVLAEPSTVDRETDLALDDFEVSLTPGMLSPPLEQRNAEPAEVQLELPADSRPGWRATLAGWRGELNRVHAEWAAASWGWPAWLALAAIAGCALALVRLFVAVVAADRHRAAARPICEPAIARTLDQVRAAAGCQRPIELRETDAGCSPSTIGWLRPAIILPDDWRAWNDGQLRAVLAHEVAHVGRGDFAVSLLAQFGVVLHFYNPLVHWLARRLRLEQEMAADVCGANLSGGRQAYLATLAEMALARNDPPLAWAARPFLPTRGTLMKRVEMLHQRNHLPELAVSRSRRFAVAVVLLVAAGLLAGLRPAGNANQVFADPPAAAASPAGPFDLDFVPNDAQLLLALRPAELAGIEGLGQVRLALQGGGLFDPLGLPLEEIEECKLAAGLGEAGVSNPWTLLVLRSQKPHDWKKLAEFFTGPTQEVIAAGQKYYQSTSRNPGEFSSYWLPDDRTIVLTTKEMITNTFALRGTEGGPDWADEWNTVADAPAAMMITPRALQVWLDGNKLDPGTMARYAGTTWLRGAEVDGAFRVTAKMSCRTPNGAQEVRDQLADTAAELRKRLDLANQQGSPPPALYRMLVQAINAAMLQQRGADIEARVTVNLKLAPGTHQRHLMQARAAARRNLVQNKLRRLGIAMQKYHDAYRHFPPAVLIGPDRKTPYSWRVALLPFLDRQDLYKQYRQDEPWDSEHNRQIIAQGAELFSVPTENPNGDCSFFLLVGPGAVFDPTQPPPRIRDITDGSSKTIGIVTAKRSVPWTMPVDIEYDPAKPLPRLGGFFPGGFFATGMDSAVHFLPDTTDEATMRAYITRAGRELVAMPMLRDADVRRMARRRRSVNTMKQLGIAMHNYHDQHGHFPPAVVMGPDGKTPHSWRVALLPYLEHPELTKIYQQYKFDEPWDSPHNQQLIQAGADFFGTAMEQPNGNSAYFMLAGPGTMGDPARDGTRIRDITDGTSLTIYFVEAKRPIPWTKPQDIDYDPGQPMPRLGGFFDGGFDAALVDGSVLFLSDDNDEDVLRRMLTTAGGEVVDRDAVRIGPAR